jgi:hypothetical protein
MNQIAQVEILKGEVARSRDYYNLLVERIRSIDLNDELGNRTAVVSPPQVAMNPAWPHLKIVGLLSFVLGCGVGLGVIYVLDLFDDRFRSPEEFRIQLGIPILAMVRQMEGLDGHGLQSVHTFTKPNGVESEAFRTLRTSISFAKQSTERVVVTSTEPGDGKTTILINLAVAYAQSGKRTLLIDADMRRPGMSTLLELRGTHGLSQILRDERPVVQCIAENMYASGAENLDVIPSGSRPINPAELLSRDHRPAGRRPAARRAAGEEPPQTGHSHGRVVFDRRHQRAGRGAQSPGAGRQQRLLRIRLRLWVRLRLRLRLRLRPRRRRQRSRSAVGSDGRAASRRSTAPRPDHRRPPRRVTSRLSFQI